MTKKIFAVGTYLPGDEIEYVSFDSDQSLLDADVIIFQPQFGRTTTTRHGGLPLFDHDDSRLVRKYAKHWASELRGALSVGKTIVVFLEAPEECFVYQGHGEVARLGSFDCLPYLTAAQAKTGREVRLTKEGSFLQGYLQLSDKFKYKAQIDGAFTQSLLTTKVGSIVVGAMVRGEAGIGSILFLPPLPIDEMELLTYDDASEEEFWTKKAQSFAPRLVSVLSLISDYLRSRAVESPRPAWVEGNRFTLPGEDALKKELEECASEMAALAKRQGQVEQQRGDLRRYQALLFEQGKPLESAVIRALSLLGFAAKAVQDGDSEFDVLFEGPEGCFLGEVEGKDSKAVAIEKLSQLERNIQEHFLREGVERHAKGVLFGNAHRLLPPSERGDAFTAKCPTGAERGRIALVRTEDLFQVVCQCLRTSDPEFSKACRRAILDTSGAVVIFPPTSEI